MAQDKRGKGSAKGGLIALEQERLIRELKSKMESPVLRRRFEKWAAEQEEEEMAKAKSEKTDLIGVSFRLTPEEDADLGRVAELLSGKYSELGVKLPKVAALRFMLKLALEHLESEKKGRR